MLKLLTQLSQVISDLTSNSRERHVQYSSSPSTLEFELENLQVLIRILEKSVARYFFGQLCRLTLAILYANIGYISVGSY